MSNVKRSRSRSVLTGAIAAAIVSQAWTPAADFTADFPAALACTFDLRIEGQGGHQVQRDFLEKNWNLVRSTSAGTGSALTFTNLDTDATLSLKSDKGRRRWVLMLGLCARKPAAAWINKPAAVSNYQPEGVGL